MKYKSIKKKFRFIKFLDLNFLIILFILFLINLLLIHSSSGGLDIRFYCQLKNIILSFIFFLIILSIPINYIMKFSFYIYFALLVLLLFVEIIGEEVNGSKRWLDLGVLLLQPSEIFKLSLPMLLSYIYGVKNNKNVNFRYIIILLLVAPIYLIIRQPDLGTAILVFASSISVVYFNGITLNVLFFIFFLLIFIIFLIFHNREVLCLKNFNWIILHKYQKHRICTMFYPKIDPKGAGFHIKQSIIAIGSGGIIGKGYMQGNQTQLNFIPESTTDFIFAVYSEEFGFYGCVILILIYLNIIVKGIIISIESKIFFGRLLSASISMMFLIYVFINIGMVIGILPVVGIPLPFISYGGTSMFTMCLSCGLLNNIKNHSKKTSF